MKGLALTNDIADRNDGIFRLYRHYGLDEKLLYVGITSRMRGRIDGHRRGSPWFPEIVYTTVEDYPSKKDALQAEYTAILTENPTHNRAAIRPETPIVRPRRYNERYYELTVKQIKFIKDGAEKYEVSQSEFLRMVLDKVLDSMQGRGSWPGYNTPWKPW